MHKLIKWFYGNLQMGVSLETQNSVNVKMGKERETEIHSSAVHPEDLKGVNLKPKAWL